MREGGGSAGGGVDVREVAADVEVEVEVEVGAGVLDCDDDAADFLCFLKNLMIGHTVYAGWAWEFLGWKQVTGPVV